MELEQIRKLSEIGEEEYYTNLDDSLEVPQGETESGKTFKVEDVIECFSKPFAIRELALLVGSTAIHQDGKAHDVDLVLPISDLSEDLQTAIEFRLMRGFAGHFKIPYDKVPKYLHIHKKEVGESPFTSWIPIYKLGLIPAPDEERTIHKMSLDDEIDNDKFEILEKSKRRIIAGIASTDALDLEGEKISRKALEKIWRHIETMPDEYRNLMLSHTSTQIGKILMSYKNRKSALLNEGLYLIAELRQDIPIANDTWKDILNKKLHSFSIKINIPKPLNKNIQRICDDDKCWMEIKDAFFIEYTLTPSPANPDCNDLQILSKEIYNSLD